ncbi:MAG: HAMP domain-containing histidine kinase [Rickettsiales bacterium]|nr:HAMP domain-containing histidine kinase [Rickettsiales bacterium]
MKSVAHSHNHFSIIDHILRLITDNLVSKKSSNDNSQGGKVISIKNTVRTTSPETIPSNIKTDNKTCSEREFIKSIIHELKNPIHTISGLSQILRDEKGYNLSPSERIEYLNHIEESVSDLNDLVHDLLEVSSDSNEDRTFSIDLSKEIDIKEIVRRTIKLNKDYAIRSGITINSEIADDVSFIKLDQKRTKQILANLVSNSIKYSPEKTTIKISLANVVEDGKKYLEITVSDQGFGMTEEQIELAFEKYKTIQNPNSGKVDSFGLGLPIVKQLVELQKGIIDVISEPNKGTDFILKFRYC